MACFFIHNKVCLILREAVTITFLNVKRYSPLTIFYFKICQKKYHDVSLFDQTKFVNHGDTRVHFTMVIIETEMYFIHWSVFDFLQFHSLEIAVHLIEVFHNYEAVTIKYRALYHRCTGADIVKAECSTLPPLCIGDNIFLLKMLS